MYKLHSTGYHCKLLILHDGQRHILGWWTKIIVHAWILFLVELIRIQMNMQCVKLLIFRIYSIWFQFLFVFLINIYLSCRDIICWELNSCWYRKTLYKWMKILAMLRILNRYKRNKMDPFLICNKILLPFFNTSEKIYRTVPYQKFPRHMSCMNACWAIQLLEI